MKHRPFSFGEGITGMRPNMGIRSGGYKMKIKRGDGVLKVIIIVFTAITIGNGLEYLFINKENLKHIKASVEKVKLDSYSCGMSIFFRRYCEKTTIYIEGVSSSFIVKDQAGRGAYLNGINKGDKVDIYIRKWYQYILTFGSYRSMYILEKNGEVYYDFEKSKTSKEMIIIYGIIATLFLGLYIWQRATINKLIKPSD
jgi:hypothetical protein